MARRDSLREGLKAKGRTRREAAVRHAEAEQASTPRRNDILPSLRIESYPLDALKSHARKLRKSDPAHIREIANSISTLGFNVPLLVGKDNVVVDGDSRLEAAKLLGLLSVPCIRVDHLDETEQRLLRLAVNRLGEKGFWDVAELEAEFKELIIADAPIEISGFGSDEIDQILIGDEDGPSWRSRAVAGFLCHRPDQRSVPARPPSPDLRRRHRSRRRQTADGNRRRAHGPDRRTLQCRDRRPRDRGRASGIRDGFRRNDRFAIPRL